MSIQKSPGVTIIVIDWQGADLLWRVGVKIMIISERNLEFNPIFNVIFAARHPLCIIWSATLVLFREDFLQQN